MQKQVQTSLLNIAYEEQGDIKDPVIILVHGFPDDAGTWDEVAEALAQKRYRTLAPYLRGYGKTRFLSDDTMRSGQYTAFVTDIIEFANALNIEKFILTGHDWGATISYYTAALYPER